MELHLYQKPQFKRLKTLLMMRLVQKTRKCLISYRKELLREFFGTVLQTRQLKMIMARRMQSNKKRMVLKRKVSKNRLMRKRKKYRLRIKMKRTRMRI